MAVNGDQQRDALVDAARALLLEEGYGALSARRVTARCGLKSQLLYYYFETMDDLVLEVLRRINAQREVRFREAVRAEHPLSALWALNSDPQGAVLAAEMMALAVRREPVRAAIARSAAAFRALQVEAVDDILRTRGLEARGPHARAVVMMISALARTTVSEAAIGLTDCHADAVAMIEQLIALSGEPSPSLPEDAGPTAGTAAIADKRD